MTDQQLSERFEGVTSALNKYGQFVDDLTDRYEKMFANLWQMLEELNAEKDQRQSEDKSKSLFLKIGGSKYKIVK